MLSISRRHLFSGLLAALSFSVVASAGAGVLPRPARSRSASR